MRCVTQCASVEGYLTRDTEMSRNHPLFSGVGRQPNTAFCRKGSNELAVNGAAQSVAQLHSAPQCL